MSESLITRLDASQPDFAERLDKLLAWESVSDTRVAGVVDDIIQQVKTRGDAAVLEFTNKFDRRSAKSIADLVVTAEQAMKKATFEHHALLQRCFKRSVDHLLARNRSKGRHGRNGSCGLDSFINQL